MREFFGRRPAGEDALVVAAAIPARRGETPVDEQAVLGGSHSRAEIRFAGGFAEQRVAPLLGELHVPAGGLEDDGCAFAGRNTPDSRGERLGVHRREYTRAWNWTATASLVLRYRSTMDIITRNELIRRYAEGYGEVESALSGISEAELDNPDAQGWTPRQVVHHLADSEMTSAMRLRKLVAEANPVIWGYDEELYSRTLAYDRRPIGPSLAALKAARETTLSILEHLSEEEWAKSGWHTESGPYSVERWLEIYAAHAHDHAEQIRKGRHRR